MFVYRENFSFNATYSLYNTFCRRGNGVDSLCIVTFYELEKRFWRRYI